jgi:6-phosphofructokinase 1
MHQIAINFSGGYVPGLNAVVTGAVLAARQLGWRVVGIRDGFDGVLFPDRYLDGGLVELDALRADNLRDDGGAMLGTAGRADPFHVRTVNAENMVEEVDRSDELLQAVAAQGIDAVISVVGARALSILFKLHRKGLKTVCIPESVENDVAETLLSYGFNSALSYAAETLDRARHAARSAQRIGVIEVLGEHAGWLALQAGMAVCADAVLIPEIPYDLHKVATKLRDKIKGGRPYGLVVVAEGATSRNGHALREDSPVHPLQASLTPNATEPSSPHAIGRSGRAAESVALELQRLANQATYPLVLGPMVKAGAPTAVDRQLGLGYGTAAVRALHANQSGVMVTFQPPDLRLVPLEKTINRYRTVPANSLFIETARALGISLGD